MALLFGDETLFDSFFIGGFESSCHRLRTGRRLNMLASTRHDRYAEGDYLQLQQLGVNTVRDGICWPEIEREPGRYDFSSALPLVRAARETGTQVIWDLCHYGFPDDVEIFRPEFVRRFAALAGAFARLLAEEGHQAPFIAPINEISFWAWGGGDAGYLNPFEHGRSFELKVQLARAAIEGIEAVWDVTPRARIVHIDPVINVVADPARPHDQGGAEDARRAMYQAWDLLRGSLWPQIGGDEKYLDILGVNYYADNQWVHGGGPILRQFDPLYRPFRGILREVYERYRRPLFVAETGAEGDARVPWLRYVGGEVRAAMVDGVPVEGITLYPVLDYPGWDDGRYCPSGLLSYADAQGRRQVYEPLAVEMLRQLEDFDRVRGFELLPAMVPYFSYEPAT